MSFLQGQETLTIVQWILRATMGFFFLLIIAKVLGQRTIAQLRILDFAIVLVIGDIIAHPLSDEHIGVIGAAISSIALAAIYISIVFSILKFPSLRKLINSAPIIIVKDGKIIYKGLERARISIDILLEELRKEKVINIEKVALAIFESDGKISVFMDSSNNPATVSQLNLFVEPFELPKVVIKEGKINNNQLKEINKNEQWITSKVEELYQTNVKNILLATIDSKGNLVLFLYR